jgi:predicted enzyme related to lactoylglutathione lyase
MNTPPPTLANGKICYLEIPAPDPAQSAAFYKTVFGWNIRARGDGCLSFDDTVGQVSGAFRPGWKPQPNPGIIIYIWTTNIEATIQLVTAHGGTIVQPLGADAPEFTARFTDPAGNLLGLYQEPKP